MMAREDLTLATIGGEKVAFVLPVVDETMPAEVREGLVRRRLTVLSGRCPCGATFIPPNRRERRHAARTGRVLQVAVEHEPDCPAGTERILDRLRTAGWSQ